MERNSEEIIHENGQPCVWETLYVRKVLGPMELEGEKSIIVNIDNKGVRD